MHNILINIVAIMPELSMILSGILFLMLGVIFKSLKIKDISLLCSLSIVLALVLLIYNFKSNIFFNTFWNNTLFIDSFTIKMRILLLISGFICMVIFTCDKKTKKYMKYEIPILLLFSLSGMSLMICSNDLIMLYLSMEFVALSMYVCVACDGGDKNSTESALKYFILGSLASCIYLFGASLVYGLSSITDFIGLSTYSINIPIENFAINNLVSLVDPNNIIIIPTLFILGVIMIFILICFKTSTFPMHMWAPDVYQGANTSVSVFIATTGKIAAVGVFVNILYRAFPQTYTNILNVILLLAVISIAIGTFAAFKQSDLKRFLAYSGTSHMGFILLTASSNDGVEAKSVIFTYLSIYILITIGVFASLTLVSTNGANCNNTDKNDNNSKNNNHHGNSLNIDTLSGIAKKSPFFAICLAVSMFSLAGIPPFAGFFAKLNLLYLIIAAKYYYIALYFVLMTVISCYYYIRIIKVMYFDEYNNGNNDYDDKDNKVIDEALNLSFSSGSIIKSYTLNIILFSVLVLNIIYVFFI